MTRRLDRLDLALARKVLQTEAAAILALVDRLDDRFERAVQLLHDCRGRVIVTGMGKSGIICRKIAATLVQHRHARVLPASGGSDARRPRRDPDQTMCCSRCLTAARRGSAAAARNHPAARRAARSPSPATRLDARAGRGRRARLSRVGRSVSAESGADREHHRRAGAGRRARDDAARGRRDSARRISRTCIPAASSARG